MVGFMYKDFYIMKSSLFFLGIVQCFFFAGSIVMASVTQGEDFLAMNVYPITVFVLSFILTNVTSRTIFSADERSSWQNFAISTPGAMKTQIQAKYLFILLINLCMFFVCMLTDAINVTVSGSIDNSMQVLLFLLLCWNLFSEAVSIPFTYVFTSSFGQTIKILIFSILALLAVIYGLFGDISFFLQENFIEALRKLEQTDLAIWIIALIPYAAVACFYMSYRISLRVYRKGIENYE